MDALLGLMSDGPTAVIRCAAGKPFYEFTAAQVVRYLVCLLTG